MTTLLRTTCEMVEDCPQPVTMIDVKGFIYCTEHGMERRFYQRCRKLRPHELRKVQRGIAIDRY